MVEAMRVLIAAGGTGGHIYPGIAVAKEIMRRDAGSLIRFVGTARGLENRLVPQAGFELSLIESAGLVNMGLDAETSWIAHPAEEFSRRPPCDQVFRTGCCRRRRWVRERACINDGLADGSADGADGIERGAGIYESAAGALC